MPPSLETGSGQAFVALINQALRAFHDDESLRRLAPLADWRLVQTAQSRRGLQVTDAVRAILLEGLAQLQELDPVSAPILYQHFIQRESVAQVAQRLKYAERSIFKHQQRGLARLSQLLWRDEEQARRLARLTLSQQHALDELPSPAFSRLFGADESLPALHRFINDTNSHWLVALDGMGGIGKTALARAAAEQLIYDGRFERVIWITVQQRLFAWGRAQNLDAPALSFAELLEQLAQRLSLPPSAETPDRREKQVRQALRTTPTLLIVDNLETASDVQSLVMGLHRLCNPTCVLMTSRYAVGAYEAVTALTVKPLKLADAIEFIRYEGHDRNIEALHDASDEDLIRVARITDGNPLAIKWVMGQLLAIPLAQVLDDLVHVSQRNHDLYHYLFAYAWQHLSPLARRLLIHMPLLDARGAAWQHMAAISGAPADGDFCRAIQELTQTSLLNVGRRGPETIYSIHRLTEYFVLSELVRVTPVGAPTV